MNGSINTGHIQRAVQLLSRAFRLMFTPTREFLAISQESESIRAVTVKWVIPLVLVMLAANLLHALIVGIPIVGAVNGVSNQIVASPRPSGLAIPTLILPLFVHSVIMPFIMALVINALAGVFGAQRNYTQAFRTAAYVGTSAWVVGIFWLPWEMRGLFDVVPPRNTGLFVGAIWGAWLLFRGLPSMMSVSPKKSVIYTSVIVVIMGVLWIFTAKTMYGVTSWFYAPHYPDDEEPIQAPTDNKAISERTSSNCNSTQTAVERMICGNEQLATLDKDLASAYRQGLRSSSDPDALKHTQRTWLSNRNRCRDAACLRASYQDRIAELHGTQERPRTTVAGNSDTGSVWSKFGNMGKPHQPMPQTQPVDKPSTGASTPSSPSVQALAKRLLAVEPDYWPDQWKELSVQELRLNAAEQRVGVGAVVQISNEAATQAITIRIYESRNTATKAFEKMGGGFALSNEPDYDTIVKYSLNNYSHGDMRVSFEGAETRLVFKTIACIDEDLPAYFRTAALHERLPMIISAAIKEPPRKKFSDDDRAAVVENTLAPLIHFGWIHIRRALEASH